MSLNESAREIINLLSASMRGQIFLCNLQSSLRAPLLDPKCVSSIFSSLNISDFLHKHEDSVLGLLRGKFQDNANKIYLTQDAAKNFYDFCGGGEIVTVITLDDYIDYYSDGAPSLCCLLYTSPSPRDRTRSRMPSSA